MAASDDPPNTPGSTAGRRWLVAWVFLAALASLAIVLFLRVRTPAPPPPLPPGWTRLTTERDGLSVDLPAEPKKSGPVEKANGGSDTSWICVVDGYTYAVRRMVNGALPADPDPKSDDILGGFCDGLKSTLPPDGLSWRDVTVADRAGREMRYRGQKAANVVMRLVQIDRTLYIFLVGAPIPDADLDGADVTHFLDSVRLAP